MKNKNNTTLLVKIILFYEILYYINKYFIFLCNIYNQKLTLHISNSYGIILYIILKLLIILNK